MSDIEINVANEENAKSVEPPKLVVRKGKIRTIIPVDPLNPDDKGVVYAINGKVSQIKRGEEIEIDENIYQLLREAGYFGK